MSAGASTLTSLLRSCPTLRRVPTSVAGALRRKVRVSVPPAGRLSVRARTALTGAVSLADQVLPSALYSMTPPPLRLALALRNTKSRMSGVFRKSVTVTGREAPWPVLRAVRVTRVSSPGRTTAGVKVLVRVSSGGSPTLTRATLSSSVSPGRPLVFVAQAATRFRYAAPRLAAAVLTFTSTVRVWSTASVRAVTAASPGSTTPLPLLSS